ncbi:hypothetical protein [Candidatus Berkiella aquae]|uniref:Uncharacterized protein n=1 Tax=Candidatus Berkiella aquae TaxID=295108 RepID=A0A0Q9YL84_9GAMM|nr:hypothetical protein [Candidatus Berkiella aquae]MCS5711432.1 hypothetical protein [Candidatus Berkiella aquae]
MKELSHESGTVKPWPNTGQMFWQKHKTDAWYTGISNRFQEPKKNIIDISTLTRPLNIKKGR